MRRAFEEAFQPLQIPERQDGVNVASAHLIFELRQTKALLKLYADPEYRERTRQDEYLPVAEQTNYLERLLQRRHCVQERLCHHLVTAANQGQIGPWPEAAIRIRGFFDGPVRIVTTNWDRTIETAGWDTSPVYLHGSTDDASNLYLPSEMIDEPWRDESRPNRLSKMYGDACGALSGAERLIIWGLSLSPLDAELGALLRAAVGPCASLREVMIIDLNPRPVAARLRFFADILQHSPEALRRIRLLVPVGDQLLELGSALGSDVVPYDAWAVGDPL